MLGQHLVWISMLSRTSFISRTWTTWPSLFLQRNISAASLLICTPNLSDKSLGFFLFCSLNSQWEDVSLCPLSNLGCHGNELKLVTDQGQHDRRKTVKIQEQVGQRLLQQWTGELRLCGRGMDAYWMKRGTQWRNYGAGAICSKIHQIFKKRMTFEWTGVYESDRTTEYGQIFGVSLWRNLHT